jgi:thiol:disulfide interchange protein
MAAQEPASTEREIFIGLNREQFASILGCNPGVVVVKFTADWCIPCKNIQDYVYEKFALLPENCVCADLDVDENFDLYALMKSKKQVRGIPAILAYRKGNVTYAADESVSGSDTSSLDYFFQQVENMLSEP